MLRLRLLHDFFCQEILSCYLYNVSKLLWPPSGTHQGLARSATGAARKSCCPFQKGTTSSFTPWMMKTGQEMLPIRSMFGNIS